jgi:hypothetical protein
MRQHLNWRDIRPGHEAAEHVDQDGQAGRGDAAKLAEEMRISLVNQVCERRNPRTKATVNQVLDRYLVEVELVFSTRDNDVGYAKKHIRPLLGETKVGALDAGVMDSLYAELQRCRDHCKKTKGQIDHRTTREHECDARCARCCRGPSTARTRNGTTHWAVRSLQNCADCRRRGTAPEFRLRGSKVWLTAQGWTVPPSAAARRVTAAASSALMIQFGPIRFAPLTPTFDLNTGKISSRSA